MFSLQIGERSKPGLGGAVTSFINGVGQVGGVVEGPIIGRVEHLMSQIQLEDPHVADASSLMP